MRSHEGRRDKHSSQEIFKVKINNEGSLDKLTTRIVVRGDLQSGVVEDKWSPTASFRFLKMFLEHASRLKARVKQFDFIGAFLQATLVLESLSRFQQLLATFFQNSKIIVENQSA